MLGYRGTWERSDLDGRDRPVPHPLPCPWDPRVPARAPALAGAEPSPRATNEKGRGAGGKEEHSHQALPVLGCHPARCTPPGHAPGPPAPSFPVALPQQRVPPLPRASPPSCWATPPLLTSPQNPTGAPCWARCLLPATSPQTPAPAQQQRDAPRGTKQRLVSIYLLLKHLFAFNPLPPAPRDAWPSMQRRCVGSVLSRRRRWAAGSRSRPCDGSVRACGNPQREPVTAARRPPVDAAGIKTSSVSY